MVKKKSEKRKSNSKEIKRLKIELGQIIRKERADRKKIEKKNIQLVKKTKETILLHKQMESKNKELKIAYKKILDLLAKRTEFMNRAAHDLRTPLTPIMTLVPIVKGTLKDHTLIRDLTIVEKNSKYLKQLVDELIELIKTGGHDIKSRPNPISVEKLVKDVLLNEESIFLTDNVEVVTKITPGLPKVYANKLRLSEALRNLVANAVKFMPNGGRLQVEVYKKDNFIYIKIKDNGIGMTKKTLQQIFDPFFKADTSRHTQGTGLGLTICKEIVNNYRGSISADSKGKGKGSEFTIKLPTYKGV